MSNTKVRLIRRCMAALICALLMLAPIPGANAATIEYMVTATKVNLREEASTSSGVVTVLRQGATLTLLEGPEDGWLKVSAGEKTGYLSAEYACLISITGSGAEARVFAEKLNVRSAPDPDSKSLGMIRRGSELPVLELADGWLKVSFDGKTGYVSPEYVSLTPGTKDPVIVAPAPTAVPSVTAVPEANSVLKKGDRGEAVRALQEKLITLGFLSGRADGVYGSGTVSAVKSFQRSMGLTADGDAGPSTLAALTEALATPTPKPTATPAPTPTAVPSSVLQKGDRGDAVKALQEKLIALGFLSGKADGIFGNDTRDAVMAFQRNKGMHADGKAGPDTLAALESVTVVPSNPSQPDSNPVITDKLLKKGSRGEAVSALQEKLISLGYLAGPADGYFGNDTVAAVKAFQHDHSLTADGKVGTSTFAALNSASGNIESTNPTGVSLLKYGDKGDAVKALQTRLKELGYFNGTIGGNFGTLTRDAVKSFQTAAALTNDGIAGEETLNALFANDAPRQKNTVLRAGDSGEAVQKLQTRLIELGYLTGTADGRFGSATQTALMAFQSAAGLSADGVAGQTTQNRLYASDAPVASAPPQPDSAPTAPPANSAVAEKIIATAKKYLGCKYVYACEDPPYFDCSGLTQYVFKQYGYSLLRTAYQQGYNDQYQKLTIGQLKMGDLVFFNTNLNDGDKCDHTGIYIGNGDFIHASSSAGKVIISNLSSGYYNQRFSWGRRILTD